MHSHDPPVSSRSTRARGTLYRSPSSHSELAPLSARDSDEEEDGYSWEENGYAPGGRTTRTPSPMRPHSPAPPSTANDLAASSAFSTVLGLLVHSLADGISLGASSISSSGSSSSPGDDASLDFVIFLAIMVHKAPAAFALSSLLSSSPSLSTLFRQRSLLAFSLAAPVGAVLTYLFLSLVGAEGGESIGWWTGLALVFSGGTFLFVATHVMKGGEGAEGEGVEEKGERELGAAVGGRMRMGLVIAGMCTPLVLSKIVGHGH